MSSTTMAGSEHRAPLSRFLSFLESPKGMTCLIVLGSLAMFLVLSGPLFRNEVFLEDEMASYYVPYRFFYAECLKKGHSFLWCPNAACGFYLHGEAQVGMCHPLHLLLHRCLPLTSALDLEVLLTYPFMFLGVYFLMRRWRLETPTAMFGALCFTMGGYSLAFYLWLHVIATIAHTPWLLLSIDVAMRSRNARKVSWASFGIVILSASQMLVGYPQMVYITGLAEGLYALFLLPVTPRRRRIFVLLGAKLLAVSVAAIQLLPLMEHLSTSVRAVTTYEYRMSGTSLFPLNLFHLVSPYLFHGRDYTGSGFGGMYGGATVTVLVAWLVVRYRRLTTPRLVTACFLTVIVVGVLFSLGKYGFVYRYFSMLPVVNKFRGPDKHLALFHIGWVVIATFAFSELASLYYRREKAPWRELAPLFILPLISLFLAVIIGWVRVRPEGFALLQGMEQQMAPNRNVILGVLIMVTAALLFVAAARGWRYGLLALVVFTMLDLAVFGLRHKSAENLQVFIDSIDTPNDTTEFRLVPDRRPVYSVAGPLMKGYSMAIGHMSIHPERYLAYDAFDTAALRLAGARWIRSRLGATPELAVAAERGDEWVEVPAPMPRARLVARVLHSIDPAKDVHAIDIETTALVRKPLQLERSVAGDAEVLVDLPGEIQIRTSAPQRQLLVTTETYHNGWRATVDGCEQETLRVNGDFLGCVVAAEQHIVRFKFAPRSFEWGKRITLVGLVLTCILHLALPRILRRSDAELSETM